MAVRQVRLSVGRFFYTQGPAELKTQSPVTSVLLRRPSPGHPENHYGSVIVSITVLCLHQSRSRGKIARRFKLEGRLSVSWVTIPLWQNKSLFNSTHICVMYHLYDRMLKTVHVICNIYFVILLVCCTCNLQEKIRVNVNTSPKLSVWKLIIRMQQCSVSK